jgi:hypothetical protein
LFPPPPQLVESINAAVTEKRSASRILSFMANSRMVHDYSNLPSGTP